MNFLFEAVKLNDVDRVKRLLDNGAPIDQRGPHGETPLMAAVAFRRAGCAAALAARGADVNAVDDDGRTVLMVAIGNGDIEMAWSLLLLGADPEAHDNECRTVTDYASRQDESIQRLIDGAIRNKQREERQKILAEKKVLAYLEKEAKA